MDAAEAERDSNVSLPPPAAARSDLCWVCVNHCADAATRRKLVSAYNSSICFDQAAPLSASATAPSSQESVKASGEIGPEFIFARKRDVSNSDECEVCPLPAPQRHCGDAGGEVRVREEKALEKWDPKDWVRVPKTAVSDNVLLPGPRGVDDCANLPNLQPAAVIENLRLRYAAELPRIYTAAGPNVLFAINPLRRIAEDGVDDGFVAKQGAEREWVSEKESATQTLVPCLADTGDGFPGFLEDEERKFLRQAKDWTGGLKIAHPRTTAERCWRKACDTGLPQAVILTGDSGAGKTETAKRILGRLSELSNADCPQSGHSAVSFASNILYEAFGNACTVHNRNSSRFGKLNRLTFAPGSKDFRGASVETYLLEKNRLTSRDVGEQNFHIFYAALLGAPAETRADLKLCGRAPESFALLQPVTDFRPPSTHESFTALYRDICRAASSVGLDANHLFQVVAGLLHWGNSLPPDDAPAQAIDRSALAAAASLFRVPQAALEAFLTKRVAAKNVIIDRSRANAAAVHGAFVRTIYNRFFERVIVNSENRGQKMPPAAASNASCSVSVLDIYGFEILQRNSLEQLLINFANERLHAFFVDKMIDSERSRYARDGVFCPSLAFQMAPASQSVLVAQCLASGAHSLLSALDDCSKLASAASAADDDDGSFREAVRTRVARAHPAVLRVPRNRVACFEVAHFAGDVAYTYGGWLRKNADREDECGIAKCLAECGHPILRELWKRAEPADPAVETVETAGDGLSAASGDAKPGVPPRMVRGGSKKAGKFFSKTAAAEAARTPAPPGRYISISQQFCTRLSALVEVLSGANLFFVKNFRPNSSLTPGLLDTGLLYKQMLRSGAFDLLSVLRNGFPHSMPLGEAADKLSALVAPSVDAAAGGLSRPLPLLQKTEGSPPIDRPAALVRTLLPVLLPRELSQSWTLGKSLLFWREPLSPFLEDARHCSPQKRYPSQICLTTDIVLHLNKRLAMRPMRLFHSVWRVVQFWKLIRNRRAARSLVRALLLPSFKIWRAATAQPSVPLTGRTHLPPPWWNLHKHKLLIYARFRESSKQAIFFDGSSVWVFPLMLSARRHTAQLLLFVMHRPRESNDSAGRFTIILEREFMAWRKDLPPGTMWRILPFADVALCGGMLVGVTESGTACLFELVDDAPIVRASVDGAAELFKAETTTSSQFPPPESLAAFGVLKCCLLPSRLTARASRHERFSLVLIWTSAVGSGAALVQEIDVRLRCSPGGFQPSHFSASCAVQLHGTLFPTKAVLDDVYHSTPVTHWQRLFLSYSDCSKRVSRRSLLEASRFVEIGPGTAAWVGPGVFTVFDFGEISGDKTIPIAHVVDKSRLEWWTDMAVSRAGERFSVTVVSLRGNVLFCRPASDAALDVARALAGASLFSLDDGAFRLSASSHRGILGAAPLQGRGSALLLTGRGNLLWLRPEEQDRGDATAPAAAAGEKATVQGEEAAPFDALPASPPAFSLAKIRPTNYRVSGQKESAAASVRPSRMVFFESASRGPGILISDYGAASCRRVAVDFDRAEATLVAAASVQVLHSEQFNALPVYLGT